MRFIAAAAVVLLMLSGCSFLPAMAELDDAFTVVIDPGHGGRDGGASTPTGVKESDLNLEISARLESLLGLMGWQTVMTRTEDTHLGGSNFKKAADIKARLAITEENAADVLVSIHQNHYSDSRYGGSQVFYGSSAGSDALAQAVQSNLKTALDEDNNRTIKSGTDTAYLMKNADCTAILVECGFLSNPADAENLQSDDYQKKVAMAVAAGLIQFKGESPDES
ncbi:MAG: N-acetylmuramoyl-L-alanine amidase [Ruminococcaceae bacterium]|nr:N-acetylmuramoyl-L-alanine amidase [Oscillospiraceae bacterium]